MRRPAAAVLGTIAGAALLLGARLGTRPPADLGAVVTGPPEEHIPGAPGTSADPSASGAAATVPHPSRAPGATTTVGSTSRPPTQPPAGQSTAPAPTGGSGLRSGTFTGVAVTHKYGTLQVTITVASGKITDADASYATSSQLSSQITGEALPKLRQEALAAQSADIATVSGATYTSGAYRSSLRSALDRAKG